MQRFLMTRPAPFALCAVIALGAALTVRTPGDVQDVWQTDGYGRVIAIGGYRISVYDITPSTCTGALDLFTPLVLQVWELTVSEDSKTLQMRDQDDPHVIRAQRLSALPARCARPAPATAVDVFTAFSESMANHYAFFDRYGVDWDERVADARDSIRPGITDADLYFTLARMLHGIADEHVYLEADIDGRVHRATPGQPALATYVLRERAAGRLPDDFRFMETYWNKWVLTDILGAQGKTGAGGQMAWGILDGQIGYLALRRLDGFAKTGAGALGSLDQALEAAMQDFQRSDVRAVILDLTANPGGSDHFARSVAARFTETTVPAYTKHAADAADPVRTHVMIHPANGTRFLGPVRVVTSNLTASAAEVLTLALRQIPTVIHVGERTAGSLSDTLDQTLPNGWTYGLSNEIYLDAQGMSWEGAGIPPDHSLTVFDLENLTAGHSAAVAKIRKNMTDAEW